MSLRQTGTIKIKKYFFEGLRPDLPICISGTEGNSLFRYDTEEKEYEESKNDCHPGRARYDFEYRDREDPAVRQNDGTRIIYLNAKGDTASLNEEQKVFLEYLAGNAAEDELCSEVNEKADLLKYNDRKKDMKRPGLKQSCECMREVSVWNRSVSFQT